MKEKKTIDATNLIAAIRETGVDINYLMKDLDGTIWGTKGKPSTSMLPNHWIGKDNHSFGRIAVTEFEGKTWTECVYERDRGADKSDWIGCLCVFAETEDSFEKGLYINPLVAIVNGRYVAKNGVTWSMCRPLRSDEAKIFNADED